MLPSRLLVYWLFVLSCICILQWSAVSANCLCHEKGTDYCNNGNGNKCSERHIVRPKPRYYKPNPDLDLSPIGDSCSCNKLLIEPALLPKPCKKKPPTYPTYPPCKCKRPPPTYYPPSGSYYPPPAPPKPPAPYKPRPEPPALYSPPPPPSYGLPLPPSSCGTPLPPSSYALPEVGFAGSTVKDGSPPADPISVSLALQASKAIQVPEAKLAYGFVQRPLDGLKKIYFSNVPEENLFKLNSEVITLKKRQPARKEEEEEELPEDEEDSAETDDGDEAPQLTYKQLGYVAEQFKNPKFREVTSISGDTDEDEGKPVRGKVAVDCGFRPGRIAEYRKIRSRKCYGNCY